MSNETHFSFDDGLPTRPDVDLLIKTWPSPKIGDRFAYETIEKLLRLTRRDVRFRTVTTNWRERMRKDFSLVIECERGETFYVAGPEQVSNRTHSTLQYIVRKAHKHRRKLAVVAIENDQQRALIEHQGRLMLAVEKDAKKARMNLLPATEVATPPQIAPPKAKGGKERVT